MSPADLDAPALDPAGPPVEPRLATRAAPPTPRRLSRRVLATSAGIGAIGIATAIGVALTSSHHHADAPEQVPINNRQVSDALATAPKDYSAAQLAAASKLPLPGTEQPATPAPMAATADTLETSQVQGERKAALQQQRQRRESARSSKLFAGDGGRATTPPAAETSPPAVLASGNSVATAPDAQDRKATFVAGNGLAGA